MPYEDSSFVRLPTREAGPSPMTARRLAYAYLEEVDGEVMRTVRIPSFMISALVFPSLFYLAFVCLLPPSRDPRSELFWFADYASFAAITPGLFVFGLFAAGDRDNGYGSFKRALPAPAGACLIAKAAVAMLVTMLGVVTLMLAARLSQHAMPQPAAALRLTLAEMLGTLPFCAAGMLIGSFIHGRSVFGLMILLLMPLAFLSGLLVPLQLLPPALQAVALVSPGYDLLSVARASIEPGSPAPVLQIVLLLCFTLIVGGLAEWRLRYPG